MLQAEVLQREMTIKMQLLKIHNRKKIATDTNKPTDFFF